MTRAVLAGLIVTGCWRDPPPVAPDQAAPAPETATLRPHYAPPTPCELAVDHALAIVEQFGDVDPVFTAQEAHLRPVLVEHCNRMQWSDDALQCVSGAQTFDDLSALCRDRFTQDQLTDVGRVIQQPSP
jgi:hypothetical protein